MNKYNMQCDITVFHKYNPPTLIYTCGSHDDMRLFILPKAERM